MRETQARDLIVELAGSMYDRGLTFGSSGNVSVKLEDGWLMTPTNVSMGRLDPARLSKLDSQGNHLSGDKPTKETFLHRAMYDERPSTGAVVHLHSTHSVAVSCMAGLDPSDLLPPITAYYVMRVGRLPLIPYYAPGDLALAEAVRASAANHHAMLLANHGPIVAGNTLETAVNAMEELEETAKLFLMLQNHETNYLTRAQVAELRERFPS